MVKENPRILARRHRRKKHMQKIQSEKSHTHNPIIVKSQENPPHSSLSSSPPLHNPLKRQSPPSSSTATASPPPPPLKFSLSSPEPASKKRLTSASRSLSDPASLDLRRALFQRSMPVLGKLPPLPPPLPPSPVPLGRADSDPAPLRLPISDYLGSRRVSKKGGKMSKVFDEIANENGHRSDSKSKPSCNRNRTCCTKKDDDEKKMRRERSVGAEKIEGDWTMIKINCPCGSDYQLLISEVEKKCYYKLV